MGVGVGVANIEFGITSRPQVNLSYQTPQQARLGNTTSTLAYHHISMGYLVFERYSSMQ